MPDGTLFGNRHSLRVVDLFCGAGGTSLGVEMGLGVSPVAAVNHWDYAIRTHAQNHPTTLHFQEDVFNVAPWQAARGLSIDLLVGSPDCTHFSTAKGSAPRDTGRRALADVFIRWAREIRPRVIILENVREFQGWGPLDSAGQPIPERKGELFRAWVGALEAEGYVVEWRLLRACDYGAPTSRLRLFVVARRDGQPIRWPAPTHGAGLIPYRTAAEIIDWSLPCPSIFDRPRPLADATCRRIAEGIQRFVVGAAKPFIATIGYGERAGQSPRIASTDAPLSTVVAGGVKHALVSAFIARHFSGASGREVQAPLPTVTTVDHNALVCAATGSDKTPRVAAFLQKFYGASDAQNQGVQVPLGTVTTRDRFALTTVNISGEPWQIVDIGMRMLQPRELASAQGFPADYIFNGSKTDQTAAIGNSVVPQVMAALTRANLGAT